MGEQNMATALADHLTRTAQKFSERRARRKRVKKAQDRNKLAAKICAPRGQNLAELTDWRNVHGLDSAWPTWMTEKQRDAVYPLIAGSLLNALEQSVRQELAQWRREKNLSASTLERGLAFILAVTPRFVRKEIQQFRELQNRLLGILSRTEWQ